MSRIAIIVVFSSLLLAAPVAADTVEERIKLLEKQLSEQQALIDGQEQRLKQQSATISNQKQVLESQQLGLELLRQEVMMESRGAGPTPATGSSQNTIAAQDSAPKPVGQAPAKTQQAKPEVGALADIGGVLTPRGKLVLEPALQYSHSSVNRVTFRGIEILSSLGIGILEAVDADRDAVIASITGRLGLTNRLEFEVKVPYVWRRDKESAAIPQLEATDISTTLEGQDLGDIELALHYQLNNGLDGWPFFIANGRLKLNNADGPFDIDRDDEGIGRELATGSGFYSFEPSITALYPSAPAVFFGNLGYLINIKDDVGTTIGEDSDAGAQTIGVVDPGDAFRVSFGMAYSINERASFTLGFKNDWIQATTTEINGFQASSSSLNIGSMLLGYSFQLTPKTGINLNLEFGITDDAPDMSITFRMPFTTDALW
ncbi:MAG: transporter [Motiliproteus sp.]